MHEWIETVLTHSENWTPQGWSQSIELLRIGVGKLISPVKLILHQFCETNSCSSLVQIICLM